MLTELHHAGTTYYVIGTAHVSQASVEEVEQAIADLAPDAVAVELCQTRLDALTGEKTYRDLDIVQVLREGRGTFVLVQLLLSAYQRRLGKQLGVRPGAELLAAVTAARARGLPVALIDRDVSITLRRTWANLGTGKRAILGASMLFAAVRSGSITKEAVEQLKEKKQLSEVMDELAKAMPEIKAPLIDERDQYLASKLVDAGLGRKRVIAVVGAAHVPGIIRELGKDIDRAALERLPVQKRSWRRFLPTLAILGLSIASRATFVTTLSAWVVPVAVAGAAMTLLVGGSPFAVLASLIAQPLGVFGVNAGAFVGTAEARWRRPTTADRDQIGDDTMTARGFFRNGATRILVISAASSLGRRVGLAIGLVRLCTLL